MNFLRIALFVIVLVVVFFARQWMPWSGGTGGQPQLGSPQSQTVAGGIASGPTADSPAIATPDNLQIDGHAITSVATIRNFRVVDGDSIRWNSGAGPVDYRLAAIDAPELSQPFGQRSKMYLQEMLAGKELTAYQTDVDRYGRRVAFMFATSAGHPGFVQEVNAKMIADGYAWHAIDYSRNPKLNRLETSARSSVLGLWGQRNPVTPWDYRRAAALN